MNKETAGRLLASLMSDISEEHYCASWLNDLKYDLWKMLIGGDREYGMGTVDDQEITDLIELAREAGGWCDGDHIVPTDEWIERFAVWFESRHLPTLVSNVETVRSWVGTRHVIVGRIYDQSDVDHAQAKLEAARKLDPRINPLAVAAKAPQENRWH